jgi:hypothetical protein
VGLSGLLQFQGRFDEAIAAADWAMARDSASVFSLWAIVATLIDSRQWDRLAHWEPRLRAVSPIIATYARSYPALPEGRPLDACGRYGRYPTRTLPR